LLQVIDERRRAPTLAAAQQQLNAVLLGMELIKQHFDARITFAKAKPR
jgi:hypothetical protein